MSPPVAAQATQIIIIDDDPKLCDLIREYLEPLGYAVNSAHTGPDGLEAVRAGDFSAVILDVMLPGMDGFEVLKAIRHDSNVPVLMLTGPIYATQKVLDDNGLTMDDIDVVEINEAFASVVLSWEKELQPDMETVNPNGGAIAIGHPLGGTGAILLTKAVHELHRADKEYAIVTMCCGGGLGTGTLIRRS